MNMKGSAYLPLGVLILVGMAILAAETVAGNTTLIVLGTAIAAVLAVSVWLMPR